MALPPSGVSDLLEVLRTGEEVPVIEELAKLVHSCPQGLMVHRSIVPHGHAQARERRQVALRPRP